MPLYRVDVVFPMVTGLDRDVVQNTFHFESSIDNATDFSTNANIFLKAFYDTIYGPGGSTRVSYIEWRDARFRTFNLEDTPPRVPVETQPWPIISAGSIDTPIPTEVAIVASFESEGLPGERYQRRYNRVYLGALPTTALSSSADSFPVVAAAWVSSINQAMKDLQEIANGPQDLWVQVSRATGTIRTLPVSGGWVDNSPDTQRRRSVDATAKTRWSPDPEPV